MENPYRLIGKGGDLAFNRPADSPPWESHMFFVEFIRDASNEVTGAKYLADHGHGYGFNNGYKEIIVPLNEEVSFNYEYTDTSDGTWDDGFFTVRIRLVKTEG